MAITKEKNKEYIGKLRTLLRYLLEGKITKDQHHQLTRQLYEVYVMGVPLDQTKPVSLEDIKNQLGENLDTQKS